MDKNSEKILMSALKFFEQSKTKEEIFDLYPAHQAEIKELFETVELLHSIRGEIRPSKESLHEIISRYQAKAEGRAQIWPRPALLRFLMPVGALAVIVLIALSVVRIAVSPALPESSQDLFGLSKMRSEAAKIDFDTELYKLLNRKPGASEALDSELKKIEQFSEELQIAPPGASPKEESKTVRPMTESAKEIIIFLLKKFEEEKIKTAEARREKISDTLLELKNAGKNTTELERLFVSAESKINAARVNLKLAQDQIGQPVFSKTIEKIKADLKAAYQIFENLAILAESL